MRFYIYPIHATVIVNNLAESGLKGSTGKLVEVIEHLETGTYDYLVKFDDNSTAKVKESELNPIYYDDPILNINKGDIVIKKNGTHARIVKIDYFYRQVEIEFKDNTYEVLGVNELTKNVNETFKPNNIDEKCNRVLSCFSSYKNENDTYTISKQMLLGLIRDNLK